MTFRVIGAEGTHFAAEKDVFGNRDLAKMVLLRASPGALGAAMLTCRLWCEIIKEDSFLCGSFIVGCIEKFYQRKIVDSLEEDHLLHRLVIMHLLRGDFYGADEMLYKIDRQLNRALTMISGAREVESQKRASQDKDGKKVVLSILAKAKNLLDQVVIPMGSPVTDKEHRLCMIAKMEAAYDTSIARETRNLIKRRRDPNDNRAMIVVRRYRDLATLEIVKNEAAVNLTKAEDLVKEIFLPENKIAGLCRIAMYSPERRSEMLEAARNLLVKVGFEEKDKALIEIAKVEVLDDPSVAAETVSQGSAFCHRRLDISIKIAIAFHKKDPEQAKAWAAQIFDKEERAKVCIKIAELDRSFLNQAVVFARQEEGVCDRFQLLIEIAKLDPLYFAEVNQIALSWRHKDSMFRSMAEAQAAVNDIKGAKDTAKLIEEGLLKAQTLFKIAEIDPEHDFGDAKAAALALKDPSMKVKALCEIAKALMRNFAPVDDVFALARD